MRSQIEQINFIQNIEKEQHDTSVLVMLAFANICGQSIDIPDFHSDDHSLEFAMRMYAKVRGMRKPVVRK